MKKKDLSQDIENLQKTVEEWKSKYLRALADYQNLEKRITVQKQELTKFATKQFVLKILPVLDILETAENHLKNEGLSLGVKQFRDVFKSENIEKIEVSGKKFDPLFMECVEVVESDRENEVLTEVRPGYFWEGQVLRAAQVKVGKKNL